MEVREELDDATTEAQVAAIRHSNKSAPCRRPTFAPLADPRLRTGTSAETLSHLSKAFRAEPPDLDAAKNLVIKLRYLQNVENVCREWAPGRRIELQH